MVAGLPFVLKVSMAIGIVVLTVMAMVVMFIVGITIICLVDDFIGWIRAKRYEKRGH